MLRRIFKWLRYEQPKPGVPTAAPTDETQFASNEKQIEALSPPFIRPEVAQPNLHRYLQSAAVSVWPSDKVLFHGCTDQSKYTDIGSKSLEGDYKWMSEDPAYAADYAFFQGLNGGRPYLFICRLQRDGNAIEERQSSLHKLTNWGASAPWRFPTEFGSIAKHALDSADPIIFLDHFNKEAGRWGEILVSDPKNSLVVVDVIQLPNDKEAARRVATSYNAQK
jgi:hypothetical protein